MFNLIEFQGEMSRYLATGRFVPESNLPLGSPGEERLRIHRNNSYRAILDALASSYPSVRQTVGEQNFDWLGSHYLDSHPPRERTLVGYGEGFADLVEDRLSQHRLPYLADLARLDRAFLEASIAGDAQVLDPAIAALLDPASLCALAPGLHPSVRLLRLSHAVGEVWETLRTGQLTTRTSIEPRPQVMLLARPQLEVVWSEVGERDAEVLQRIGLGESILEALANVFVDHAEGDLVLLVAKVFQSGVLKGSHHVC